MPFAFQKEERALQHISARVTLSVCTLLGKRIDGPWFNPDAVHSPTFVILLSSDHLRVDHITNNFSTKYHRPVSSNVNVSCHGQWSCPYHNIPQTSQTALVIVTSTNPHRSSFPNHIQWNNFPNGPSWHCWKNSVQKMHTTNGEKNIRICGNFSITWQPSMCPSAFQMWSGER